MAANYIVINSKFKPFSYAEMLQPVKAATEAHQKIEDEYADLATKANVWEGMANEQSDPYAYKMYKTYADDLEKKAGQLAREGLNPASRQEMLQMKQRYSSDIVPIEQAYKRRQELADAQREALTKDSTMMFSRNAASLSLDDLIKNPSMTYTPYSGTTLINQATVAAKNFAKDLRENPRKWGKILQGQYFETAMKTGFTRDEILKAVRGDEDASPVLRKIMDDVVASSGIADWNDPDALRRAYEYAGQGIWSALGETTYDVKSNKAYDYAMQSAKSSKGDEPTPDNTLYYRAVPRTAVDASIKTNGLKEGLDMLNKFIENPDLYFSTYEGPGLTADEQGNLVYSSKVSKQYSQAINDIANKYFKDIKIKGEKKNGKIVHNFKEAAKELEKRIGQSAIRDFTYTLNITDSSLVSQVLQQNSEIWGSQTGGENTGLREVDSDGKIATKSLSSDKIYQYFTPKSYIEYDPTKGGRGGTFLIHSGGGIDKHDKVTPDKVAAIDTELLDDQMRTINDAMISAKKAYDEGEFDTYNAYVDALMKVVYMRFNTLAKKQSETDSRI